MKPQALQDAIKAKATNRIRQIQNGGGWKEPIVKKHIMTAEEFALARSRQSPAAVTQSAPTGAVASPPGGVTNGGGSSSGIVSDNSQLQSILYEMKQLRHQVTQHGNQMEQMKKSLAELQQDLNKVREENQSLRENILTLQSKRDIPSCEPHTAKELFEQQRKDRALREYMTKHEGLYPSKYMSIQDYEGNSLVLFKRRLYIPIKLREKTVKWYFQQCSNGHSNGMDFKTALKKNCIWPEIEEDMAYMERDK